MTLLEFQAAIAAAEAGIATLGGIIASLKANVTPELLQQAGAERDAAVAASQADAAKIKGGLV